MPVKKGFGKGTTSSNIKELMKTGSNSKKPLATISVKVAKKAAPKVKAVVKAVAKKKAK